MASTSTPSFDDFLAQSNQATPSFDDFLKSAQPDQSSKKNPAGLLTPGNIDLSSRPVIRNPDGTTSTVRTITIEEDGKTILIPTAVNGKIVSDEDAIKQYHQTGQHMGIFDSEQSAEEYDRQLHNSMGWNGAPGSSQAAWQAGINPNEQRNLRGTARTLAQRKASIAAEPPVTAEDFKQFLTQPGIPIQKLAPEKPTTVLGGIGKGAATFAAGLTSPESAAMLALGPVFGVAGELAPWLPRTISAAFTADMANQIIKQSPEVMKAIQDKDYPKAAEKFTEVAGTGAFAGLSAAHALGGSSLADLVDAHNARAEALVQEEANRETPVEGGEGTPIVGTNRPMSYRPTSLSPEGKVSKAEVIDPDTGEVLHSGDLQSVQDFIAKNSTVKVEGGQEGLPVGEPIPDFGDFLKSQSGTDITPGHTAEMPTGTYTVTKVEDGKVHFTQERPDGSTTAKVLPENIYRRMVAGATQTQQAPAPPSEEVIQQPTPAVTEPAGAATGEQNAPSTPGDQGVQQPGAVRPAEGVPGSAILQPVQAGNGGLPVAGVPQQGGSPPLASENQPNGGVQGPDLGRPVRRVTGLTPIELSPEGHQQIADMVAKVMTKPFDWTISGPMERTQQTAAYFSPPDAKGQPTYAVDEAFAPAARGELEGQPADAVKEQISDLLANPAKVPVGISPTSGLPGESQNQFEQRLLSGVQTLQKDIGAKDRALVVTSGGNLQAIDAWAKAGSPTDFQFDHAEMSKQPYWSATGQLFRLGDKGLEKVANNEQPGLYFTEHGATAFNPPKGATAQKTPSNEGAKQEVVPVQPRQEVVPEEQSKPEPVFKETEITPTRAGLVGKEIKQYEPGSSIGAFMDGLKQGDSVETPSGRRRVEDVKKLIIQPLSPGVRAQTQVVSVTLRDPQGGIREYSARDFQKLLTEGEKKPVTPQIVPGPPVINDRSPMVPPGAVASQEQKPTIEAGGEENAGAKPATAEPERPIRPEDRQPLEEQLPEGSAGVAEGGAVAGGGGKVSKPRKPRARASAEQRPELEPSGGTVSGVVGDPAKPEQTFPPRAQDVVSTHHDRDYRIPDGRVISGSPETRAKNNIEALTLLRRIEEENRPATVEEQKVLAGYVGWGAVPQLFAGNTPEWREVQDQLKNLISTEEYEDARRSTTNAHYTGDNVVDAMWKAMEALGAKPGMSWLEPAVGVGNFFGRQPETLLEGARRIGVDKDTLTGKIAQLLYPDSGIEITPFEDAELPDSYFDGAISNVPFGNFGVHDARFKGKPFLTSSIHNYFFARALTMVRPGGVVGFITSRYTMDGYDKPIQDFRRWVSQQADFLGSVRLPSGAFRQNAGTDVIADVIFLRRRLPDAKPAGENWSESGRKLIPSAYGQYPINVNDYYKNHPEMILGKEKLSRGQFTANDYDVEGNVSQEALESALKKIAEQGGFQDYEPAKRSRKVALREISGVIDKSKLGGFFFDDKGALFRRTSKGSAEPVEASGPIKERIRGQLAIRDALIRLTDAELAGKPDGELNQLRKALNMVYDQFVKKNGFLSSQSNTAVMKGDPDAPLLVSLERRFDKGNKAKGQKPSAEKAPIFSRRMLKPPEVPSSVDDPKDALYITLNEKGRLDWDRISELTGKSPEELQSQLAGLVYQDPKTKIWQTAEEYLSGSVRNKLKEARAIAKVEPAFKQNVDALEKIQPEDIPPGEISALLGVTWVPIDVYSQFASEMLGAERPDAVKVKYAGGNWIVDTGWGNRLNNSQKWGTARISATELLSDSLNMRRSKVYDRDADGSTSVNPDETKAARSKQMEMQEHFEKWLFEDTKRGDQLARIYNDLNNDLRLRTYDGAHLTLPGMTKDAAVVRGGDLDPHQKAAVWRQIVQPNVLLAHTVGAGKTFEMIAAGMELKRLGLIQRPMYVVPNATLTGWQDQFAALYPNKRVIVFSEKDLEKQNRQRIMAQIATGDWDAVVVPHSSFQFLATGDEIFQQRFDQLASELEDQIGEAREAGLDTRQIKRMEKAKERLLTNLKDRRDAESKDLTVTWEQLGIDQLFVDESHEYKKLGFATKQGNVAGIDQQGNQKTFDLLMKMRYTQKHGRGVVFATGTPVTNTMGELYSIMKYLIEPEMQARGMGKFDEWAANFGRTVDVFEPKVEGGGYQLKARFAEFVNLPELATLFRSFADVVTPDMVNLPKPKLITGDRQPVITELSPDQEAYLKELQRRAESIRRDPRGALPDNMLAVYTDAAKMAMDLRMVDPSAPEQRDGRLNQAADKIYELWKESTPTKGAQLVVSDMGKPEEAGGGGSAGFSAYDELIRQLVERGIPRDQIAHIYQAKNKTQRARIFQDVNDGKIRVLLGSTQKVGVGTNIQKRLYALHHLDIPHRPSDLEQREGRILRQGNENPAVHVFYYMTRGSLDEAKFANVTRKAKFINQVLQGKAGVRKAEDVGGMVASLAMFQAMTSGDPRVMRKMEIDAEVDRLAGVYAGWKNQQYKIRQDIQRVPWRISNANKNITSIQRDIETSQKTGDKWQIKGQKFAGTKAEGGSKEVNEAFRKAVDKVIDSKGEDVEIGSAYGLPLRATFHSAGEFSRVTVDVGDSQHFDVFKKDGTADFYRRTINKIEGLKDDVQHYKNEIDRANKDLKALEGSVEEKWPYTEKLQGLVEEQQKLVKELGTNKGDEDAAAAVGDNGEIADASVKAAEPEAEEEEEDVPEQKLGLTEGKAGERGAAPLDFLSLGAAKFVEKDVIPTLANVARAIGEARGDIRKVIAPAARGSMAKEAALTVRERAADLARSTDRAAAALDLAHKYFETRDTDENLDFIDKIETGQGQGNGQLQGIADTMRQMLDDRRQQVQDLGTGKLENFYEDYFPHVWKKPEVASKKFMEWFAKRPMEGAKSFLKKRTIPTIKDGIDMGLEPESSNPVDLVLSKVREMDKYIFAHRALDDLKSTGVLKFKRETDKMPDGFAKINDRIAQVYEGKTAQGSLAKRGEWVAPEPAALILNNYLSPGLRKYPSFRAYMGLANILNQFQLGWSAYHLGFTTFEAMISRVALGISQAAHGSPIKGLVSVASAPIAPFQGLIQGDKLLKEWYKPGSQGQEIADLVDAMVMAGGRARMDRFYSTQVTKKMMEALRQGNVWGAALRAPFALTEQAARPIMEWIVPRQKMAVFADLAREELAKFDNEKDPAKLREALARSWDSVDNRMGQLVYDNLFWNKAVKDLAMASVRSVGWNTGTIRELLGGGADTVNAAGDALRGKKPEFTSRMAYIIALPIVAGLVGGMLHYLNTGQSPEELKDWYFPRRGPKGTPGWEKRMTLPSYVKDIVHYAHDPYGTLKGKIHPALELILEMLSNEDYFGRHVRNSNDPLVKQMEDEAKHVGETVEPIAVRPLLAPDKKGQETTAEKVLPFIGITEAPKYIKEGGQSKKNGTRHR